MAKASRKRALLLSCGRYAEGTDDGSRSPCRLCKCEMARLGINHEVGRNWCCHCGSILSGEQAVRMVESHDHPCVLCLDCVLTDCGDDDRADISVNLLRRLRDGVLSCSVGLDTAEPDYGPTPAEEARKRALERIHRVDNRCTHGYGDGLCECEPPADGGAVLRGEE